jgi:hypothetical protein
VAGPDDRSRLSKTYRDLDGKELLALYGKREDLSEAAVDTLRDELKLRGIDPDSLKPTVPKAAPTEDEPPNQEGDAALADGPPPELPEELKGEFDPSNMVICPACQTPNLAEDPVCRSCGVELKKGEAAPEPEPEPEPPQAIEPGGAEPGTLASATFGLIGIAGLVFAGYVALNSPQTMSFAEIAAVIGAACLGIAVALYRKSRA